MTIFTFVFLGTHISLCVVHSERDLYLNSKRKIAKPFS